jgi:hypothetical protein
MIVERMGHVLGQDGNVEDIRIDTIGQSEVDDPKFSGKGDSGFGPVVG